MNTRPLSKRTRCGGVFLEALVSIVMISAALAGVIELLVFVAAQRRMDEQRLLARLEAGNQMETIMSQPWSALIATPAPQMELSSLCRERLPDPALKVEVIPEAERDDVRRIHLQITWQSRPGGPGEQLRLVAWRYQAQEANP